MKFRKRLLKKIENAIPGTAKTIYADRVNELIRARYSLSEELSILRRRDEAPETFAEYTAFAEACKAQARAEMEGVL